MVEGVQSDEYTRDWNVLQESVLSPKFFSDYASSFGDILHFHGINFHTYADDTQLYIIFFRPKTSEADDLECLEKCVGEFHSWMAINYQLLIDWIVSSGPTSINYFGSP